jgi:hypothetical protein
VIDGREIKMGQGSHITLLLIHRSVSNTSILLCLADGKGFLF